MRLQLKLKPYKDILHNKTEISGTIAGIMTIGSGILFSEKDKVNTLNVFILVVVIIANIMFFIRWFYLLFRSYKDKNKFINFIYLVLRFMVREEGEIVEQKLVVLKEEIVEKREVKNKTFRVMFKKGRKKIKRKFKKVKTDKIVGVETTSHRPILLSTIRDKSSG
mmetsp:Transcript_24815/g.22033  ORF Transcript_24815/g.22033 Transcript_24815/m.22033 type:complete len:165 (-) Transcript_24815:37-531(-)